jgi:cystathionine beta-lyase/cystathionine gamma-synthase
MAFLERLELVKPATTLGDVATLALHPATSSHRELDASELVALGIDEALLRLSIGIENARDIIADLERALSP